MSSARQHTVSAGEAHRSLLYHSASSNCPTWARTWQAAQGLLSARTASCQFPSTGRVFSSESLVGSVTSLAGISGLSSFPLVQTHLADKRGFESLQTHSVAPSRGRNLAQSILVKAWATRSVSAAWKYSPPAMQSTHLRGQMQRYFLRIKKS